MPSTHAFATPHCPADQPGTGSLSVARSKCPKCATNKAGQRSCCARGGAWFKNCGDTGDTKVHTWVEGIQACEGVRSSVEPPPQVILRGEGGSVSLQRNEKSRNAAQQETSGILGSGVFTGGSTNAGGCVGLVKGIVCMYVLILWSQILSRRYQ